MSYTFSIITSLSHYLSDRFYQIICPALPVHCLMGGVFKTRLESKELDTKQVVTGVSSNKMLEI